MGSYSLFAASPLTGCVDLFAARLPTKWLLVSTLHGLLNVRGALVDVTDM